MRRQFQLSRFFQYGRVDVIQQNIRGFRQNVGHTLVGRRQRGRFIQRTEVAHRFHARIEISRFGRTTCQHSLNGINCVTFFLIPRAETTEHEINHFIDNLGVSQLVAVQAHCFFGQGLQIKRQVFLNDDTQNTQRGTTQCERVFIAFRMLTDAENTGQGVHLVSDCQRARYQRSR
ncbi:hypothetical protein SRABI106_04870 [Rahnella aquatilis]|nr:hypothetical protein SRABI106_04870 [Rahnella aquatilis]